MTEERQKFVQAIYLDATSTIRHYDGARTSFGQMFGSLLSFLTAGLAAALSADLSPRIIPFVAVALTLLSAIALLVNAKLSALIALQRSRAAAALAAFEPSEDGRLLVEINEQAKRRTARQFGSRYSLSSLWMLIFATVAAVNLILLIHLAAR